MNISGTSRWRWLITVSLFVLAGLVLRIPGMRTDFWLDEIWTLYIVHHQVRSVVDVFTVARVDNNHPLNTLLMYEIGDWAAWWVYRIPALLAGLGAIGMAMRIAERRGRPHAIAAGVLFAISFPMILYSTEARGYGLMIFFTLWAVDSLDLFHRDHRLRRAIPFAAAVVLGCLSNSTFILGYAAMVVWSICEVAIPVKNFAVVIKRMRVLHFVPILFILFYFLTFVRHLQIGGSNGSSPGDVAGESVSFALGFSNGVNGYFFNVIALLISIVIGFYACRSQPKLLGLMLPGIWLAPAVILAFEAMRGVTLLSPRHLLAAMVFLLLAAAMAFGESWRRSAMGKVFATGCLAGLMWVNLWQVRQFDRLGRGHYLDAFEFIVNQSGDEPVIGLSADQPNRTQMILDFYWRYLPHDHAIQFASPSDIDRLKPRWYIGESDADPAAALSPPDRLIDGLHFVPRATYPCYGLSGSTWTIYERVKE